jgi:hypothetical protein
MTHLFPRDRNTAVCVMWWSGYYCGPELVAQRIDRTLGSTHRWTDDRTGPGTYTHGAISDLTGDPGSADCPVCLSIYRTHGVISEGLR